jgi:NTP pyrophosphatase (non-canonical NTP hydrolase)
MDRLQTVIKDLRKFVAEREWSQFHDPKNLAMAVSSEAGELLAEYRWISNTEADQHTKDPDRHARISAEAADVGIALLLFCDRIGVDLLDAIQSKMITNSRNYPADKSKGKAERPKK